MSSPVPVGSLVVIGKGFAGFDEVFVYLGVDCSKVWLMNVDGSFRVWHVRETTFALEGEVS